MIDFSKLGEDDKTEVIINRILTSIANQGKVLDMIINGMDGRDRKIIELENSMKKVKADMKKLQSLNKKK